MTYKQGVTSQVIAVLMHCHHYAVVHPHIKSPVVSATIRLLVNAELVEVVHNNKYYTTTEKGRVHVTQLCGLPLPVSGYMDLYGRVIDFD